MSKNLTTEGGSPVVTDLQDIEKRLKTFSHDNPPWNQEAVIDAMKRHYMSIGLKIQEVKILEDLKQAVQICKEKELEPFYVSSNITRFFKGNSYFIGQAICEAAEGDSYRNILEQFSSIPFPIWECITLMDMPKSPKFEKIITSSLDAYMNGLGWYIPLKNQLILIPVPRFIGNPLHNELGKAVQWENGTGLYFLYGVCLEELLWKSITENTITEEQALQIDKYEQQVVALASLMPRFEAQEYLKEKLGIGNDSDD